VTNTTFSRRAFLRLAAALLLAGQLLYVVVTLFHADGNANNHPAVFAAYAGSEIWTAVHVAQFGCMTMLLGGLLVWSLVLDTEDGWARAAGRLGAAAAVATLALYGGVLAVDGVALKQATDAWVVAPEAEQAARFAAAEAVRWLEWGMRSYENFTLGAAVLLFAAAAMLTAWVPRPLAYLMVLAGLTYWVQGWVAGAEGFPPLHTTAIVAAEVLNVAWMIWLTVIAWQMREPALSGRSDQIDAHGRPFA
jgi:hypothetical protein